MTLELEAVLAAARARIAPVFDHLDEQAREEVLGVLAFAAAFADARAAFPSRAAREALTDLIPACAGTVGLANDPLVLTAQGALGRLCVEPATPGALAAVPPGLDALAASLALLLLPERGRA